MRTTRHMNLFALHAAIVVPDNETMQSKHKQKYPRIVGRHLKLVRRNLGL